MRRCHQCGKILHEIPYTCRRCGNIFCSDHHLPENHHCHGHPNPRFTKLFRHIQKKPREKKKNLRTFFEKFQDIILSILILIATGIVVVLIIIFLNPSVMSTHNPIADVIVRPALNSPTETTVAESQNGITYINSIRARYGKSALTFDIRLYNLAKARAMDLDAYNYFDHTNPVTGSCAWSIKSQYGLQSNEYAAENLYGSHISVNNGPEQHQAYHLGIEEEAAESWLTSRGHRYNLLYSDHISGAVYCSPNSNCVFLGMNHDMFGEGCHTGTEGYAFWNTIGAQTGEV